MESDRKGTLMIIGGAEDKTDEMRILKKFVRLLPSDDSKLLVLTTATKLPDSVGEEYRKVFDGLHMTNIDILNIDSRDDANDDEIVEKIRGAEGIFFTGGDQLRITSIIGGSKAYEAMVECYLNGGVIAGTSAGASVMSNIMIVEGESNEPARKCTLKVAPGFNLLKNSIIDQHFAQRGRIGRLFCGVAANPDILGIGIDEDTSIIVYPDDTFEVYGTNSITIADGKSIQDSNVSELEPDEILAITNITVHVLPDGYCFDLKNREVFKH
ncbi:cyanophycinase [Desulfuribacillus stibiiarsenatis]|uniref:Cyanophycinase n=1 Tax=Desulfuribacillus stibiiarsenatis TaxID=1390249 RepID=A0A1E5L8B8_9FIRM|nr:cyanophycinase [Desulfuribacillus stibiiarsenatis]OEH86402.1 cyanophycinase [Desulfuribacillus stibiiarsenatis]